MRRSDRWLRKQIEKKAEVGSEIVYSLIEDTHDVHMNVNGWEFNRAEKKEDIEGRWIRLSDVLGLLDAREKELRQKLATAERKEKEATNAEWEDIWHGYAEAIREMLPLEKKLN